MRERLEGKTCLITGTGGSIGRASALMFCSEGAKVVGSDINAESAQETVELVKRAGGSMVSLHPLNLTDYVACEKLVRFALESYGAFDVLYNCGAMAYFEWMDKISVNTWTATINEELNLVFLLCKAAWSHLIACGNASIINVSSVQAHKSFKVVAGIAHGAAKGGVLSMTRQ